MNLSPVRANRRTLPKDVEVGAHSFITSPTFLEAIGLRACRGSKPKEQNSLCATQLEILDEDSQIFPQSIKDIGRCNIWVHPRRFTSLIHRATCKQRRCQILHMGRQRSGTMSTCILFYEQRKVMPPGICNIDSLGGITVLHL